jgi:hypothetical protein
MANAKVNDTAAGKAAMIEAMIRTHLGVEAELDPHYDRLKIRSDNRVQSRIDRNTAPDHMVERYSYQMGEFEFPPVIITKDNFIVDGNTRNKARGRRNERYMPVLIVPLAYETDDVKIRRKLLFFSELINNMNGMALDDEERRKMVMTMIDQEFPDEEIVNKVGIALRDVIELREQHRAMARLKNLGFNLETTPFPERTLRALGKAKVMNLDDESYRGVVDLGLDADLKANEIKQLATGLGAMKSADLQREALARERQAREPEITARRSGQDLRNLVAHLRGKLKFLLDNPVSSFIERNPDRAEEYLQLLAEAEHRIAEIRAAHSGQPILHGPLGQAAAAGEAAH